jgi:predicted HTH domain antitoxin
VVINCHILVTICRKGYNIVKGKKYSKEGETMKPQTVTMQVPADILLEINSLPIEGKTLEEKLKLNLAIGLFVSKDISLAKAAQLAEKPIDRFIEILRSINIPAVEYSEEIYRDDLSFIAEYRNENPI